MKIRRLRIKNFRSIYDLTLDLNDFTVLIGRNNSGKTSILEAIRIVFENLDLNTIKTVKCENLPENVKGQVFGLWFFKNYRNPIEIQAFVELDVSEVDDELKELCKLKEEVKGALITVRLEYLEDKGEVSWKLHKLDLLGYVSKAPEKALKLLSLYGGRIEGDIFSHCQVVDESKVIDSNVFTKIMSILTNKVHVITPFYVGYDSNAINTNIKAILRRTLIPKELLENLKKVLEDPLLRDYFYEYTRRAKGLEHGYGYVNYRTKMYEVVPLDLELFGGGEQVLDCLIATLLSKGEGHVFLIEEPEIHMHPAYIRGLAQVLEEMVKERNIQVLAITQSPELVAAVKDKSSIVGVRKRYVKVFAGPKPITEVYRPYIEDEGGYLIDTLAHELGLSPGFFFFLDVAILVEGGSDKILLQHFINLMKDSGRLKYLPRIHYNILEYRGEKLSTMIRVLHERFKVKTFVIADNDDQGRRSVKEAERAGLQRNKEVFMLSKKDILCYIPPATIHNVLRDVITKDLKANIDRLKDIKVGIDGEEKTAMDIVEEIKKYGIIKNGTDLLRLLTHRLFNEVPEEVRDARGWKDEDRFYYALKLIIAKKAVKSLKEVPDEIARVLTIIDDSTREVV